MFDLELITNIVLEENLSDKNFIIQFCKTQSFQQFLEKYYQNKS